ncbi:hypothetical protein GCM10011507_21020 [Edaphobacter acidisoli]|uniref:GYF domain-containing protein n=1 Tax=Edaphobacter acidisoli TaxID=2040573 RepID=A0A916W652_9BACT|nr:DUF4339 domain-containing protein [Edaphobacter acidisoli]GGA69314.1 hypothetical protein GCM10011507_21020 [Edaphobacter acidisoli]
MQYQVTRNGQTYGPYTLEDLQRYVASGHILPSDLARTEEQTEWVPVAQILGMAAAPITDSAGVPAAPTAYAPGAGAAFENPPNLHWALELLLGFFTLGLFVVVWNLVLAAWAKRIEPISQALMYYIIATVLIVLNFGGSFGTFVAMAHHHQPHQNVVGGLIGIASWVVRLIARFVLRETLLQHYNGAEPIGLRLSAVMTFFFGGIYFQYKLNEINQIKQGFRYRSAVL